MKNLFPDHYRFLARYNRWINQQLFDACESLPEADRQRDRGAFFGSIHRTLSHLIVADQVWLRRFVKGGADHGVAFASLDDAVLDLPESYTLDMVLYTQWGDLRAKRSQLDLAIEAWTVELSDNFLQVNMRYCNSKGVQREHPAWQAISHFFNHQTHHRGQATTLLAQAGVDVGVTDLIAWG